MTTFFCPLRAYPREPRYASSSSNAELSSFLPLAALDYVGGACLGGCGVDEPAGDLETLLSDLKEFFPLMSMFLSLLLVPGVVGPADSSIGIAVYMWLSAMYFVLTIKFIVDVRCAFPVVIVDSPFRNFSHIITIEDTRNRSTDAFS
uniref:Uncharacterized protein n=1 Tax=Glossina brevipalpis TaxID=37001 RepID=A0A1A9WNI5_9MUSC